MDLIIALAALALLITAAYRGLTVIIFAPLIAMLAVLCTYPAAVPTVFSGLFMESVANFAKLYLPVLLLGALFGKLIEVSGFSRAIVRSAVQIMGGENAIFTIMLVTSLLAYGGVSLFVVVFAVYPFAAEMFRTANIPKRLVPATIVLGCATFTMDALPGTPQVQNIIPTSFFGTNAWAAPGLGLFGSALIVGSGLGYLNWRRRRLMRAGEGYGRPEDLRNEPEAAEDTRLVSPLIAILPLVVVAVANFVFTVLIERMHLTTSSATLAGLHAPVTVDVRKLAALWAVEGALLLGIATILAFAFATIASRFADAARTAVAGALLASMNTAMEYGFGAVIAALPGFVVVRDGLSVIPDPLLKEAITVTALSGITGSSSGGLSIALGAMANQFIAAGDAAGIPREVLHRVAAMASGGMDTLPHNGAIITLLTVAGMTHREAYKDIFALTALKTFAVFATIAVYYLTGLV